MMAGQDPLENVMKQLTASKSVEPGQVEARQARMKKDRRQAGAAPSPQRTQKPEAVKEDPEMLEAPDRMDRVYQDALNEAILSIKIKKGRTTDPEEKKALDRRAENIRQQIMEAGGEPILAEETVEEGIQKLKSQPGGSMGYVAQRVKKNGGRSPVVTPPVERGVKPVPPEERDPRDVGATAGVGAAGQPGHAGPDGAMTREERKQQYGVAGEGGHPALGARSEPEEPEPSTDPGTGIPGAADPSPVEVGEVSPRPEAEPDYYSPGVAEEEHEPVRFDEIMEEIGEERMVEEAPELHVQPDMVNELAGKYGLEPRSEEEIKKHAQDIVERQRLGKEQVVERELERFQRDHPTEFDRAQQRISEHAERVQADRQEEFAQRGAYYSSVMAGALEEVDAQATEEISDIASQAASHVTELRGELRDIAEWSVVEEEVVRRELEAEDQQQRERLMQMHVEVAGQADRMALDQWYKQSQLNMQERQQQVQELQMRIEEAERQGQHLALAYMSDHPIVQDHLRRTGVSQDQWAQMSLEEQANMVASIEGMEAMELQQEQHELDTISTMANIQIQEEQMKLQAQQAQQQAALEGRRLTLEEARMEAEQRMMDKQQMSISMDALGKGLSYLEAAAETGDWTQFDHHVEAAEQEGFTETAKELRETKQEVQQVQEEEEFDLGEAIVGAIHRPMHATGAAVDWAAGLPEDIRREWPEPYERPDR